jgi:uncharacterized membrane protein HdeD (DUF308 family)
VFENFLTRVEQMNAAIGPTWTLLVAIVSVILGILIIAFPILLAWIAGITLVLLGLFTLGSVATRLRWQPEPPAPAEAPSQPHEPQGGIPA